LTNGAESCWRQIGGCPIENTGGGPERELAAAESAFWRVDLYAAPPQTPVSSPL